MAQTWTLTIDMRVAPTWARNGGSYQKPTSDQLTVVMALHDEHRRRRHYKVQTINTDIFLVNVMGNLKECFRDADSSGAMIWEWGREAANWLELAGALDVNGIKDGDGITIDTSVTAIPWDLVHVAGEPLANRTPIGLRIPTEGRSIRQRRVPDNAPRFLHVVCDTDETLSVSAERKELERMATSFGVHYQLLENPTVTELITEMSKERATPFFHFSGHITANGELLLADRPMLPDEIRRGTRLSEGAVVFLNACDDLFGGDARQAPMGVDLFKPASVANAFRDAGAGAVIAPRTLLDDADAVEAAEAIWRPAFLGEPLGVAVQNYRRNKAEMNRNSRAAYSFILYGEPQFRLEWKRPAATLHPRHAAVEAPDHTRLPIVQAAAAFATAAVAPKHLLAALTRNWLVAQCYFEIERQGYIAPLHQIRHGLMDPSRSMTPRSVSLVVDPVTQKLLARACERCAGDELDDLVVLEALADLRDPYISHVLTSLGTGPQSVDGIVEAAREWRANGSVVPATVFSIDDGSNPQLFLPELAARSPHIARQPGMDSSIGSFELFIGLLQAPSKSADVWRSLEMPEVRSETWTAGQPLRWGELNGDGKASVLAAMRELELERLERLTEGYLVYGMLADTCELRWNRLSESQKRTLFAANVDQKRWEEALQVLKRRQAMWS